MPVVICPNGHRLQVGDRQIGQTITCPSCQAEFEAKEDELNFTAGDPAKAKRKDNSKTQDKFAYIAWLINSCVGKPLLFVGLVLAVVGRGCDATGLRSVSRTNAQYFQQQTTFKLEWEGKRSTAKLAVDKKNREITEHFENMDKKKGAGEDFQKKLKELQDDQNKLQKDLNKIQSEEAAKRSEKEASEWKPYREAAMSAANHHRMWVYWYELLFICGTIVLVLGVLTVAFSTSQPAERWVAYIMIAIITFSIYVVGVAWLESIITSSGSAPPPQMPIMQDR
jgi:hypothetical protein